MQVEMLIRAHDCYSLCCSVDGIGEVLKVARDITTSLYQGKHYKLMVMDGWIDGWTDKWMDGWMNRWKELMAAKRICVYFLRCRFDF